MLKKDERRMPKYEAPIVIALGEMARGAGACSSGSLDGDTCTAGGAALTACTAGTSALDACTAGGAL